MYVPSALQDARLTLALHFFSKVFFSRGETAVECLRRVRTVFGSKTDMYGGEVSVRVLRWREMGTKTCFRGRDCFTLNYHYHHASIIQYLV
jgi:hypothetical protein